MIKKLLIANRGEIACRIARTCKRLGIAVATVHSDADCNARHVREIGESVAIGAGPATQSYLNAAAIIKAAKQVNADAVHPGIGFLSEDYLFAELVEENGMIFVGPRAETMRRFSDKWAAKQEARQAEVPVIEGGDNSYNDAKTVEKLVRSSMELPVVLKAAAGGGGRGVRIVRELDGLLETIESAMREAQSSFGRPDLIVEQFVENARHLEVQVLGDGQGGAIHLFERECSLQRRFQKVIEEAPSVNLPEFVRERLLEDATRLAATVNYRNLGTMEFLVTGDKHYFLECNPRLQVEHTVTEEITGLDLVELQLHIAGGNSLPFTQEAVVINGHAIQARVNAEDVAQNFMPATGTLGLVEFPSNLRVESGIESGAEISPHYDSMLAKLITHEKNREQALDRLLAGIEHSTVFGVKSNLAFLSQLLKHPVVREGRADNRFIDREVDSLNLPVQPECEVVATAAAIYLRLTNGVAQATNLGLWAGGEDLLGWCFRDNLNNEKVTPMFFVAIGEKQWEVAIGKVTGERLTVYVEKKAILVDLLAISANRYQVGVNSRIFNVVYEYLDSTLSLQGSFGSFEFKIEPYLSLAATGKSNSGEVFAPLMGVIAKVNVAVGDQVEVGQALVVQESMKMELTIEAPISGVISALNCAEGDMVERHQLIVEIEAGE